MPGVQTGPVTALIAYSVLAAIIIGVIFAPTLGGAIVWGVAFAIAGFLTLIVLKRIYLRLVGRRGGA